jgi:hypothetical protein
LGILNCLQEGPPDELARSFKAFHAGICTDEIRAIEFHHDLIELFCAVDAFLRYRLHQGPEQIVRIAVSGVNSVDYLITMKGEPEIN